jgi:mono/diheme cytochrome c family protein
MRLIVLTLVMAMTCCSTPVPVHWDVHKQSAPAITIPDPEFASGDAEAGRRAFVDHGCIDCHRVSGDPDLPVGKAIAEPLALRGLKQYAPNQLAQRITSANAGGTQGTADHTMKASAEPLTTKELVDIVTYLRAKSD